MSHDASKNYNVMIYFFADHCIIFAISLCNFCLHRIIFVTLFYYFCAVLLLFLLHRSFTVNTCNYFHVVDVNVLFLYVVQCLCFCRNIHFGIQYRLSLFSNEYCVFFIYKTFFICFYSFHTFFHIQMVLR